MRVDRLSVVGGYMCHETHFDKLIITLAVVHILLLPDI